jgi:hypothetical protein
MKRAGMKRARLSSERQARFRPARILEQRVRPKKQHLRDQPSNRRLQQKKSSVRHGGPERRIGFSTRRQRRQRWDAKQGFAQMGFEKSRTGHAKRKQKYGRSVNGI